MSRRKSIYIDGFSHGKNPVPAACVIGKTLISGGIFGTVRETGKLAESEEDQCRLMFENVRRVLEAAGGSFEDVHKMNFFLRPEASRELVNQYWVKAFPDPESRPARHVVVSTTLPAGMTMQCDVLAQLDI